MVAPSCLGPLYPLRLHLPFVSNAVAPSCLGPLYPLRLHLPFAKMQRYRCRLLFVPATPSALKGNYRKATPLSLEEKKEKKSPNISSSRRKNKDLPIISFLFFLFFFSVYSAASPFFLYFFLVFRLRLSRFFYSSSLCRARAFWHLPGGRSALPRGPLAPNL